MTEQKYRGADESVLTNAKELLSYDPQDGIFRWKYRHTSAAPNSAAGATANSGHIRLMVNGKMFFAHHLAWWWVNGSLPKPRSIDHINGIPSDNRIANLRMCTPSLNAVNRATKSKTGYRGVSIRGKSIQVHIRANGVGHYLGAYPTLIDAARAYDTAAKKHFGEFARLNFPQETP
jgi:hypothetical protein